MGQNMRLGSYGLDRVWSLPKLPTRLCGTNIRINCTSLGNFAPSFMQLRNGPQCIQTLRNATKHEFRLQWGGSGAFVRKLPTRHRGTNFCINCTSLAHFDRVSCSNKMVPNAPKHYKTQQNMCLGSNGVGSGVFVAKISDTTWVGQGALVAKNSDATLWHELLH